LQPPVSPETPARPKATFFSAFRFAWQGIVYVVRTQRNARIHLAVAALVVAAALALRVPAAQTAVLVLCIALVIGAEMMNTVVETIVDLLSPGYHPLAKIAKDVAAGTVLVFAMGTAVAGVLVLLPPLLHAAGR
jgi:diacylglycerol kinase